MKTLLEDYRRKLNLSKKVFAVTKNSGSINDLKKIERLRTKEGEYRAFIIDIERAIARESEDAVTKESSDEKPTRLEKLERLSFADLKALKAECETKLSYFQRRMPLPRKSNKELYDEQYNEWIQWQSLLTAVQLIMREFVEKLND